MSLLKIIWVAGSISLIGIASGLSLMPASSSANLPVSHSRTAGPTAAHFRTILMRAGLSPERLAAAGLTAEATSVVIAAAKNGYAESSAAAYTADTEYSEAVREHDRLNRLVVSGRASEGERTAFSQAGTRLAAARTARDTALDGFFNTAVAPLPEAARTKLSRFRQHPWSGTLPVEFLVATKSDEQWLAVRDAIDSVTASRNLGEEPDSGDLQLLTQASSDPAVASAKSSLDQNLAAVTAVWEQATSSL